jgi:hypothetical protein
MGQSSTYTPELAAEICARLSEGEPLRVICRDEHMPAWRTVYDWIRANPEFATRIARARELGYDAIAEEALEIADTPKSGVRTEETEDGYKTVREDMLGHRKLQVETRLKLLAKWSPKKYGDKIDVTSGGDPVNMNAEERAAKMQAIAAAAAQRRAQQETEDGADLL